MIIYLKAISCFVEFNPLLTSDSLLRTLANSVDTGEMPHNAVFHQGLHCLLRRVHDNSSKTISQIRRLVAYDFWSMRHFAEFDIWSSTTFWQKNSSETMKVFYL